MQNKPLSPSEKLAIIDNAIDNYVGNSDELRNAIGLFCMADRMGWKVVLTMYDRRSIRKYENVLSIDFSEVFEEVGPMANKSTCWKIVCKLSNYWSLIRGDVPIKRDKSMVLLDNHSGSSNVIDYDVFS